MEEYDKLGQPLNVRLPQIERLREGGLSVGWRELEYRADLIAVARRTLVGRFSHWVAARRFDDWDVFKKYHLQKRKWFECVPRSEKGRFFRAVYRVEMLVGRACRQVRPYALYPIRDYFAGQLLDTMPAESTQRAPILQ